MHEHSRLVKSENTDLDKSYAHIHKITMGLEGRVSSLGGAGRDYAGGDDIFEDDKISVSDFRFLPQMAATCKMRWAQLLQISAGFCSSALPSSHLLCPRQASAASFA